MTIDVRLYSKKHAKVVISHEGVNFDPEMLTKEDLEELLGSLRISIGCIEFIIDAMERLEDV